MVGEEPEHEAIGGLRHCKRGTIFAVMGRRHLVAARLICESCSRAVLSM